MMPYTPYDAKGLLKSAVRNDNPVVVIENKLLYGTSGHVPEEEYLVPIGKAEVRRKGNDVTVIATSRMNAFTATAAEKLAGKGIDVEWIDVRTLKPLDMDTIAASIAKTHRAVIVNEGHDTCGFSNEISSKIMDRCFYDLDAPALRVAAEDVPIPYNSELENEVIPAEKDILTAVKKVMEI